MSQFMIQRLFPVGNSMFGAMPGTGLYVVENETKLIPAGDYIAHPYNSPKRNGARVLLLDVPDHEYIEFHPANWWDQLEGCIAPGMAIGWVWRKATQRYEIGVESSDQAHGWFMSRYAAEYHAIGTDDSPITFMIRDPAGVIT